MTYEQSRLHCYVGDNAGAIGRHLRLCTTRAERWRACVMWPSRLLCGEWACAEPDVGRTAWSFFGLD